MTISRGVALPKIIIPNTTSSGGLTSPVFKQVKSPVSKPSQMTRTFARSFLTRLDLGLNQETALIFF